MTQTPVQLNPRGIGGPGNLATRGRPSIARGADARAILEHIAELSHPFGTVAEIAGESALISAG